MAGGRGGGAAWDAGEEGTSLSALTLISLIKCPGEKVSTYGERIEVGIRWTDLGVSNNPAGGLSGIQPVHAPYVPLFAFLG